MKTTLIVVNFVSLLLAFAWLMTEKSWEPLITCLGLTGSLIALIFSNSNSGGKVKMVQKGGKKSKNFQSAGDIKIKKKNV